MRACPQHDRSWQWTARGIAVPQVVRTLRNECLDHAIIANEAHLCALLREFTAYYNAERPHRGLGLEPPLGPRRGAAVGAGPIRARPVLGGLHHICDRAA